MSNHEKIAYVEFPSTNLQETKRFLLKFLLGHLKISALNIQPVQMRSLMVDFIVQIYLQHPKRAQH